MKDDDIVRDAQPMYPVTDPDAASDRFRLERIPGDEENATLLFEGRPVCRLAGQSLAAHFAVEDGCWLIITDGDCPFEEVLYCHLLGPDFTWREAMSIGEAYVPGIVTGIQRLGPSQVGFCFPSDIFHNVLTVDPTARPALSMVSTDRETGKRRGIAWRYDQRKGRRVLPVRLMLLAGLLLAGMFALILWLD